MDIFECINSRVSVRSFTDEKVPAEKVRELIKLGTRAATGSNEQPWGFLIIEGKDKLLAISDRIREYLLANLHNIPYLQQYRGLLEKDSFCAFTNAQTLLVIYGNTSSHWYLYDCTLAAANIMLGAQAMGLGSCWIGFAEQFMNTTEFKREYSIPQNFELVCPMTLGYPAKRLEPRERREPVIFGAD